MVAGHVLVAIPVAAGKAVVVAAPDLDETYAALDEPASDEAFAAEVLGFLLGIDVFRVLRLWAVEPVHLQDVLRLLRDIQSPGGGQLKPGSQLVTAYAGIETRIPLLFSEGVGKGRIDLQTFVALTATNAARIYGLYPRKGTIAIGSDADMVIWDDRREVTITNDILHHNVDYTPYEGIQVTGWPRTVLSRGKVVVENNEIVGKPGDGQFLPLSLIHI